MSQEKDRFIIYAYTTDNRLSVEKYETFFLIKENSLINNDKWVTQQIMRIFEMKNMIKKVKEILRGWNQITVCNDNPHIISIEFETGHFSIFVADKCYETYGRFYTGPKYIINNQFAISNVISEVLNNWEISYCHAKQLYAVW